MKNYQLPFCDHFIHPNKSHQPPSKCVNFVGYCESTNTQDLPGYEMSNNNNHKKKKKCQDNLPGPSRGLVKPLDVQSNFAGGICSCKSMTRCL